MSQHTWRRPLAVAVRRPHRHARAGCLRRRLRTAATATTIAVTLITKTDHQPVLRGHGGRRQEGRRGRTASSITTAAGKEDGDTDGQIAAIEDAIARGDDGILITPSGPDVNPAIEKARDAGLYVIALDTPPDPPDTVDITFATDNFEAGELIGQWTKAQLGGEKATIALLDLFNDKVVSVDYNRDQGFLHGHGHRHRRSRGQRRRGGDRVATTAATTRSSATSRPTAPRTAAAPPWRTASSKNPDINVVYTINEPAAAGALRRARAGRSRRRRPHRLGRRRLRRRPAGQGRRHRRHLAAVPAQDGRARRQGDRRDRRRRRAAGQQPRVSTSTTPASPW